MNIHLVQLFDSMHPRMRRVSNNFRLKKIYAAVIGLLLLFAFTPFAAAQEDYRASSGKLSWFVHGSVLFIPEDNGMNSDPMPVLPSPGAGLSYSINDILKAELALDLYFTHYGYDYSLDRAVPYAIENRTALVIGTLLAFQAAAYFDITPAFGLRVFGGPAADLRIAMIAGGLSEGLDDMDAIAKDTDAIQSYFWSQFRWFMPVAGLGADFTINSRFKLGLDFRVWMPAYKLWAGGDEPAIEGWRFAPGIRLGFR